MEDGTDGDTVWERSVLQGPRIKQGDERASLPAGGDAAGSAALAQAVQAGRDSTGVENVDDQACYKVVLTPNEGKPETHYYDKKTTLLVKVTMTMTEPQRRDSRRKRAERLQGGERVAAAAQSALEGARPGVSDLR